MLMINRNDIDVLVADVERSYVSENFCTKNVLPGLQKGRCQRLQPILSYIVHVDFIKQQLHVGRCLQSGVCYAAVAGCRWVNVKVQHCGPVDVSCRGIAQFDVDAGGR